MSKQSLSIATELFYGKGAYGRTNNAKRGIAVHLLSVLNLGTPIVNDPNGFINAATSTELPDTETVTYTYPAANVSPTDAAQRDGILATPRNVTASVTHGSSVVAMTIVVTGTDVYGETIVESLAITATGTTKTAAGLKAFKTITSVAITAAGNAEANTLDLGFGDVLGLPVKVLTGKVLAARFANAIDAGTFVPADTTSPATATTGDVRGTFDPAGTLDGATQVTLLVHCADPSTKVGAYGVAQYSG